jgi:hypothetical protein
MCRPCHGRKCAARDGAFGNPRKPAGRYNTIALLGFPEATRRVIAERFRSLLDYLERRSYECGSPDLSPEDAWTLQCISSWWGLCEAVLETVESVGGSHLAGEDSPHRRNC